MSKPAKPLPRFRSEAEERAFWEAKGRDSAEYLDWAKAQRVVLPNLKPSTRTISLRLPQHLQRRTSPRLRHARRLRSTPRRKRRMSPRS